ncbi:MAG: hypothetical protein QGF38_10175 [Rhodospirillales bacterium]|jgi:hypothetical protein|nr:hypothetical protein [Rhodospirillales bacterium]MDP7652053.1 hypothetical protein [Rhodospirillales bacterium]HJO97448.1 hypothetical protein [Rhodospirillales bacterium]
MRKITTIAFAALLVMGFAATALADGMCSGYSAHTAQAPSAPQSVAQVPVTQTIRPGG